MEKAILKLPVDVEAQILKIYLGQSSAFVHDGQRGIYVSITDTSRQEKDLTQGQIVRIQGYTSPGAFLPHITGTKLTPLGKKKLPEPFLMTKQLHLDPSIDCSWVKLKGTVLAAVPEGRVLALRVKCYGDTITNILLTRDPKTEQICKTLIHRRITANVIATSKANISRQMTARNFHANSLEDILIDPMPGDPPLTAIGDLMKTEISKETIGMIRGIVTHVEGRKIYLQDSSGAILALAKGDHPWETGNYLEIYGIIEVGPFVPSLRAQKINRIENSPLPFQEAQTISADQRPLPSRWHHSLVTIDADLLEIRTSSQQTLLSCKSEGHVFETTMAWVDPSISKIQPGSKLRLSGICSLRSTDINSSYRLPDGISLLVRSPKDITVLKSPPWWTLEKFFIILGIVTVLTALSLVWIFLLRKRVKKQTTLIGSQIEREVTTRERQRLARELHDTLEQNMGSLALQLTSAQRHRSRGKNEKLEECLTLAQKTLAYCQKESRESIYDLRQGEGGPSTEWHDGLLLDEIHASGAEIKSSVNGFPFPLERRTRHHVIKVIREAAFNAIRHGHAASIQVVHQYNEENLSVKIIDNGCGFDPNLEPPKGHFGITGMRERAQRINGALTTSSQPGSGTTVTLIIPKNKSDS